MTEYVSLEVEPDPVKLRAEDYFMLGEAGALSAYKKTELIDGVIIGRAPAHSLHGRVQRALFRALDAVCSGFGGLEAAFEISVKLGTHQVVQPDVMALSSLPPRGKIDGSRLRLAIAVADTTLSEDFVKARIYAGGGVPEYWVADANGHVIHRMWAPGPDGYSRRDEKAFGELIESATIAGLIVDTAGLPKN
ncbi:MAG TPA: Uma2 family endonuclease [Allosphingosinicella sp.]|jgi:Uma2 family endonuclease